MVDCIRWNYLTDIRYGCGGISQLGSLCEELAVSNPLFVTDPDLVELGMTKDAIQCYRDTSTNIGIFSAITLKPTLKNIEHGKEIFNQGSHDALIAFGGGRALDAGKAIASAFLAAKVLGVTSAKINIIIVNIIEPMKTPLLPKSSKHNMVVRAAARIFTKLFPIKITPSNLSGR